MDRPEAHASTEVIYEGLSPFAQRDPETDYALLRFLDAVSRGSGLAQVYDLVSERDGLPGWGSLLSPDDIEAAGLPYLGQFVGEIFTPNMSEQQRREAIKHPINFERGSIEGMVFMAKLTLTGNKKLYFIERVEGDAYKLAVRSLDSETPNEAVTRLALRSMKDVSIVLDYEAIPGLTFKELDEQNVDLKSLDEKYSSFEEMATDF